MIDVNVSFANKVVEGASTMSDLYYLSTAQLVRIQPFFPLAQGVPRVDDWWVISGIIHLLKRGLQWRDAPREYGP